MKYFSYFILISLWKAGSAASAYDVIQLVPGKPTQTPPRKGYERLSVYCYKGIPRHVLHFWQSVRLHINNLDGADWDLYTGHTSLSVIEEYDARRSSWSFNVLGWKKSNVLPIDPFNSSCIGVLTGQDHSVFLNVVRIDFWRVLQFALGVTLFLAAAQLSGNPLLHYTCGISLGVTTSFLVALYLVSKVIPKRPAVYGFLVGGWTISLYLLQWILSNLRMIAHSYQHYVLAYFSLVALISFIVCYRWGPVSNPRTLSLIRWALKGSGLAAVFYSSNFQEASAAVVLLLLVYDIFPTSLFSRAMGYWYSKFPRQRALLTEDEYHEEGARETIKALEELRQYCSSPESTPWKTMLKLKSPQRFARFVQGESHLSDDELMEYDENEPDDGKIVVTDDESD